MSKLSKFIFEPADNKAIRRTGSILVITSIILGWIWFGWQLPLVIFLFVLGNNFEKHT
jgi:hypothetical protein